MAAVGEKQVFILAHDEARRRAMACVASAPAGYAVSVSEANRTLSQNAAQWPYLQGFSEQLQWPVNGAMCWLTRDEYKDILTAAFQGETVRLAQGMNGGVVMLGLRTSKMGKGTFSEWMEFLKATAAMRGVTPVYASERKVMESA
jgi:hypothetical protein